MLAVTVLEVFGILGVVALCVIAVGVAWVAWVFLRARRALNQLGASFKELSSAAAGGVVARDLGLVPSPDDWLNGNAVAASAVQDLQRAGLQTGGNYTSTRMPGLRLTTLADPAQGVTASVAFLEGRGLMLDVVTLYEDGSALTYRNLPSQGLEHPPEFKQLHVPDVDAAELLKRHLAERPNRPMRAVQPQEVAGEMENFMRRIADWRDQRGGLQEAELRRHLALIGQEPDDMTVKVMLAMSAAEAEQRLRERLVESFRAQVSWDEQRWENEGHRVQFVHDQMTADAVIAAVGGATGEAEESILRDLLGSQAPRQAVSVWNSNLATQSRLQRLTSVADPFEADVYLMPEFEDDDQGDSSEEEDDDDRAAR